MAGSRTRKPKGRKRRVSRHAGNRLQPCSIFTRWSVQFSTAANRNPALQLERCQVARGDDDHGQTHGDVRAPAIPRHEPAPSIRRWRWEIYRGAQRGLSAARSGLYPIAKEICDSLPLATPTEKAYIRGTS